MKEGRTFLPKRSLLTVKALRQFVGTLLLILGIVSGVQAANDFCPIQPNISRINNACRFDANGSLSLSPTGGVAPYTYNWSTGATTQSINGLMAGSYSYTVTDSEGCSASGSFSVLANDPVIGNASVLSNVECYGEAQGSASLSPSGGVGPYTYNWSNGATTATINNLTAGYYAYTVTDSEGCTGTGDFAIIQPAPVWTTFTQKYACGSSNDGMAEIFANGGTPPYTYSWSNGATTAAINNLAPGMYFYTVTDSRGCQSAGGLVCIFRSFVAATSSTTDASCVDGTNGSASINVTAGLPPLSYAWSNGATTSSISNLAPGSYGYTVTDAVGCSDSGTVSIAASPEVFASVMQLANGDLQVTASGGVAPYTYSWSNGETTAIATNYESGAYSVTVTDANGCTISLNGTVINEDTCPGNITFPGTIGSDQYFCAPGNVPATIGEIAPASGGTGPIEYLWMSNSVGGPFQPGFYYPIPDSNSPTYSPGPLDETTYFIRCVRREGCVFLESNTVVITVDDVLGATIDRPSLGCAFQTQTYSIANVGPTATVSWVFDGPVEVSSTSGQSVEVTFVGAGYLNVSATVTEDGCTGTYSERVTIAGNCFTGGTINTSSLLSRTNPSLFPNPVKDWATLDLGQITTAKEVRVYNVNQSLVAVLQLDADRQRIDLDMSNQPAGVYLIQILGTDQLLETLKLIKN
jgi:hypothetical protein